MASAITYMKEQVNPLLFWFKINIIHFPFIIFCINIFSYLALFKVIYDAFSKGGENIRIDDILNDLPYWYRYLESNIRHYFDFSFMLIIVFMSYFSKMNFLNKCSLVGLSLLFMTNSIYLIFGLNIDFTFCVAACSIYCVIITLIVGKLAKLSYICN